MRNLYYRIKNAFVIWILAIKNPKALTPSMFKMLTDTLRLILLVATENRHRLTHIACIHPDEGEKQIVSIWAGAGIGAEPIKRIEELIKENSRLKAELAVAIRDNPTAK